MGDPNSGGGAANVPVQVIDACNASAVEKHPALLRCFPDNDDTHRHTPLGIRALRRFFVCSMLSSGLLASRPLRRVLFVGSGSCSLMDVDGACSLAGCVWYEYTDLQESQVNQQTCKTSVPALLLFWLSALACS